MITNYFEESGARKDQNFSFKYYLSYIRYKKKGFSTSLI